MKYKYKFYFSETLESEKKETPSVDSRIVFIHVDDKIEHAAISKYYKTIDDIKKEFYVRQEDYTFKVSEEWVMEKIIELKIMNELTDYDCEVAHKYICSTDFNYWLKSQQDNERKLAVVDILKSRGVEIEIGGCGCCSSPWVMIKVDGETIIDETDFNLAILNKEDK